MRKHTLSWLAACLVPLSPASAQTPGYPEARQVTAPREDVVVMYIDDSRISGSPVRPLLRRSPKRPSLIRVREGFAEEILRSAEDI